MRLYDIDFRLLRKIKKQGHCVCHFDNTCPCDRFVDAGLCDCGVFKDIKDER